MAKLTRLLAAVATVLTIAVIGWWIFPRQPSILLITIDTLRPDRLGCYGNPVVQTPALDRLAAEGTLFLQAYCDMPWTTGSMASVMTGRYSNAHGLRDPSSKLDPNITTIAQILGGQGFQTGAIVGSFPLDSVYGLDKGFETYDDTFSMPMLFDPSKEETEKTEGEFPEDFEGQSEFSKKRQENDWYRPDEDVTDAAIGWLDHVRDGRPFFLWVHYFGPHEKLDRTRNLVSQEPEIIANYNADVEGVDRAVGRLIERLRASGELDRTLVVVHADHGQNLGEHSYVGHTLRIDEVAVRIPMVVRFPARFPAGIVRQDIAKNIDLFPTFLAVSGIPVADAPGRSLLPDRSDSIDHGALTGADQNAYFETHIPLYFYWPQTTHPLGTLLGPMVKRGLRTPEWKLTVNELRGDCLWGAAPSRDGAGTWHVSDPRPLPAQRCAELGAKRLYQRDISGTYGLEPVESPPPGVVESLEAAIRKQQDAAGDQVGEKFELTPEQEEKLRSLGYLK